MACCSCEAADRHFGEGRVRDELSQYRQGTVNRPTRILIGALERLSAEVESMLDVGGGIGAVLHTLMPSEPSRTASFVEGSSAYVAAARDEATRLGYDERVRFLHGDFLECADVIPQADLVILNRVVCCYPDMEGILKTASGKSQKFCALSYPRDRWYVRLPNRWTNWRRMRKGNAFRTFVHSERQMADLLTTAGFTRNFAGGTPGWKVEIYRRVAARPKTWPAVRNLTAEVST